MSRIKPCYDGGTCRNEDYCEELEQQRDDLLALVEQVEWCEMPGLRCPWCEESIDDGHAKGCPRQAAIDTVRAAEEAR